MSAKGTCRHGSWGLRGAVCRECRDEVESLRQRLQRIEDALQRIANKAEEHHGTTLDATALWIARMANQTLAGGASQPEEGEVRVERRNVALVWCGVMRRVGSKQHMRTCKECRAVKRRYWQAVRMQSAGV